LTPGEEAECIRLMREGKEEEAARAKELLCIHNLRLVAHIARKYQNADEDVEDLISIGCIGLIKAIDTFDDKKGKLASYAARCIDNELLMLMRGKKKFSREVSLYESIGQDKEGNEIHLLDVLEHPQTDMLEAFEIKQQKRLLYELMQRVLNERERRILLMRYGLGGCAELTQTQVGAILGISRSYVSRIEKKALEKLAAIFQALQSEEKN
jgi:RNA polymerase sporulation-specific sigma factor